MVKVLIGLIAAFAIVTLAAGEGGSADSGTQTVLGEKLLVKGTATSTSGRKIFVSAAEGPGTGGASGSIPTLVGDPTKDGATLQLITRGPGRSYDQTIDLPAEGWQAAASAAGPQAGKAYQFRANLGHAVRFVWIGSTGPSSPAASSPREAGQASSSTFRIKIKVYDDPSLAVLPPGPGAEGGAILTLGGGDRYCIAFGGAAGGDIEANRDRTFAVKSPTGKGCPDVPSATPAAAPALTPGPSTTSEAG
jgi:hypothetical protein